jgi:hypothetical protein
MIRAMGAIVIIGLAAGVATAQQDPIAARKALMVRLIPMIFEINRRKQKKCLFSRPNM